MKKIVETEMEENIHLSKFAEESSKTRILRDGGWECPNCRAVNIKEVTTCKCGTKRPNPYEDIEKKARQKNLEETVWKCNGCGIWNAEMVFVCKCGVKKSENDKMKAKVEEKK